MSASLLKAYDQFLASKVVTAGALGFDVSDDEINPALLPHARAAVRWALVGGRRALFESFGLHKTVQQLEIVRLATARAGGRGLIVLPLGVKQEFARDAKQRLGWTIAPEFVRRIEDTDPTGIYLTNYETIRDGKMDPRLFSVASLDEADCLRGFGGTKTFREFMALFAGDRKTLNERTLGASVQYRFVATATPDPNEYIELLAYAAFLEVMEVSQAKTRWFKRDSTKADRLTLHAHKEEEFWLWVSTWALFLQKPSDLGFSDEGFDLPPLDVHWHEIPSDHANAGAERDGQRRMFRNAAVSVVDAAAEKRESLSARIDKMMEIRAENPAAHRIIWHDLEAERRAIEAAIPTCVTVYGKQDDEDKEAALIGFSEGQFQELGGKPVQIGSGGNYQRFCWWEIFLGIGFKFKDFIQAIHRVQRFGQLHVCRVDLIYTEREREVRRELERKWQQHIEKVQRMSEIIKKYGLSESAIASVMKRSMGVERVEVVGDGYTLVNNDCVRETASMADNSVGLILTSIPFSSQYEFSPNYADFGHSDNNAHFFRQMDFLTPNLFRVLHHGRLAAIHVKDRIVPSGMTGLGFQTVYPFHADVIQHYRKHGFGYMGMKTIVTDVVRENNQTYRLGWTEQCKDGSKMGFGMPEYLLLFRKPPSDCSNGYADKPVQKLKPLSLDEDGNLIPFNRNKPMAYPVEAGRYSRARWQTDAHGFTRSSGNRLLTPEELEGLTHKQIFQLFRKYSLENLYDFEHHVRIGEFMEAKGTLPVTFMLLQPQSWHPDVWTDITRMLTINGAQSAAGREMHLCLARDSQVLTRERGYVPIQEVAAGQHVLTHRGRWRPVRIVRRTGVQNAITLKAHGVPGLTLTPDHKLWTRKTTWTRERDGAERAVPEWTEAQETQGAYINLKLPPAEAPAVTDLTVWWLVGRWLADGHIDARGCAIISCGKEKWSTFLEKAGWFAGNKPRVGTAIQLQLRDPGRVLRDILERCGALAGGKHLPPEAFSLPTEQAAALLDGYLSGDGCFLAERRRWMASSISRELLLGIAFLVQRVHGVIASIHVGRGEREHIIEGRRVHAAQEWGMSFDLPGRRSRPFVLEDGAWKKVRSLEPAGKVETWCLRVEEDESFTAEGCIVKNCPMQFDLADRAIAQWSMEGETILDPFGGLMTVPYRAIFQRRRGIGIELSHRYFLDGAFYCDKAARQMAMPDLFGVVEDGGGEVEEAA